MSESAGANLSIALVHHPVYDKRGDVVTTSVTNLDLHDIARSARTFNLAQYLVVTPVASQHELVGRILRHWQQGWGAGYNPNRTQAFENLALVNDLETAVAELQSRGKRVRILVTSARPKRVTTSYAHMAQRLARANSDEHFLLLFGTGWGLVEQTMEAADEVLPPIMGNGDYNHLSVRSAVAIVLDRLYNGRDNAALNTQQNSERTGGYA